MSLFGKPNGKKYHTRTIEVNTYEYDEQRLVVEGCLTDHRLQEFYLATGEKRSPGILHQMIIHLLVIRAVIINCEYWATKNRVFSELLIRGSIARIASLQNQQHCLA